MGTPPEREVRTGDGRGGMGTARRRWPSRCSPCCCTACTAARRSRRPRRPHRRRRREPSQVVVAVDDLGAGFNPHLLAHQSPVTTALAGLVLPSVFRPGRGRRAAARPDGRHQRRGDRPGPVHRHLRAEPRGVVDEQRPDRRRGLRLPLGADARRAGCRGRRRLPADHRRPLARRRQGRRRRVLPAPTPPGRRCSPTCCRRTCSRTRPARGPARWPTGCPRPVAPSGSCPSTAPAARSCSPATTSTGTPRPCSTSSCLRRLGGIGAG